MALASDVLNIIHNSMNKEQYKTYLRQRLSEDIETPLRNAENNKAIKKLEAKAAERMRIWDKVSDPRPHSPRAYEAGDRYVEARKKLDARIALQQKEQASKFRIGLGGKRRPN